MPLSVFEMGPAGPRAFLGLWQGLSPAGNLNAHEGGAV
jgi:hypothetical protein